MDLSGKLNELVSKMQASKPASNTQATNSSSEEKQKEEVSSFKKTSLFTDIKNEEAEKSPDDIMRELEENFSEFLNVFNPQLGEEIDAVEPTEQFDTSIESEEADKFKKASKNVASGDVFEVPGEDSLYIKKASGDYENFIEKKSNEETITRYITEMNFIEKLENLAIKENLTDELSFIQSKKELVIRLLKEKGIQKK